MSIEVVDYDELNIFIAIYSIALDYGSFIQRILLSLFSIKNKTTNLFLLTYTGFAL